MKNLVTRAAGPLDDFRLGRALRTIAIALVGLAAASCTTQAGSYYGISLAGHSADVGVEESEIRSLARRARSGDKQAQFELGIRFEQGIGVPQDAIIAKALYARAASNSQITQQIFIPDGGTVQARQVAAGMRNDGLPVARWRLEDMALSHGAECSTDDGCGSEQEIVVTLEDFLRFEAVYRSCRPLYSSLPGSRSSRAGLQRYLDCILEPIPDEVGVAADWGALSGSAYMLNYSFGIIRSGGQIDADLSELLRQTKHLAIIDFDGAGGNYLMREIFVFVYYDRSNFTPNVSLELRLNNPWFQACGQWRFQRRRGRQVSTKAEFLVEAVCLGSRQGLRTITISDRRNAQALREER